MIVLTVALHCAAVALLILLLAQRITSKGNILYKNSLINSANIL